MLDVKNTELSLPAWREGNADAVLQVLTAVQDQSLETVRLSFVDQHGILRGKTIVASDLKHAFEQGINLTTTLLLKDTSHTTVFPVWQEDAGFGHGKMIGASDFLMIPDPSTFKTLPWSPHSGWLLCDIYYNDGTPIPFSSRSILRRAISRLQALNLDIITGLEVEFHVFRLDQPNLSHEHANRPEDPPETSLISHGYQYLTESRYDQLETVADLIRRNAEALRLPVHSMEVEFGPSQLEFTFRPDAAMANADGLVLFRSMVKQVCRREGYHATFMCRPRLKSIMSSGWHLHQSVIDYNTRQNLFVPDGAQALSELGQHWVAGILAHAEACCLLSTPTINGYKRYQAYALAPDRIQWGRDNRGAMIRVIAAPGNPASRIENRVGESAANPYLYMAAQVICGIDGIERKEPVPEPVNRPYGNHDIQTRRLPSNLGEAIRHFSQSTFVREALGKDTVDYLTQIKQAEWDRYLSSVSEWEHREYFSLF